MSDTTQDREFAEALIRYDRFTRDLIRAAIDAGVGRDLIDRGLALRIKYVKTVGAARSGQ